MQHAFRQLEERGLSTEVCHMLWSPCMDLIALANIQGEVLLQRLTWQRQPVWVLPPPGEESNKKVAALAWRPDGKVLSIGYSGGHIVLCNVEKAEVVHTMDLPDNISCMDWIESSVTMATQEIPADLGEFIPSDLFEDGSEKFLPKLPALSKISTSKGFDEKAVEDSKRLCGQTSFNILVVGSTNGHVRLVAYGISPIAEVDLAAQMTQGGKIISATLSADLQSLSVVMERPENMEQNAQHQVYLMALDCMLLTSRHQELATYAMKHGKIVTYLEYLNSTLNAVSEAWEDILLEMENKLTKYAQQKASDGTVGDEFLQLLMWGRTSPDLQAFLVNDLSEKGLKKLGHSIENSYTNIQKLVLKHIHCVGRALLYHLSEIEGMAQWYDKYGVLGLSTSAVKDAVSSVGSFMLKANELLHVIDTSMKNFRAFFRWLYVVILRLAEEPVPAAISKMMMKDVNFVADFLTENFTDAPQESSPGATKKSGFTLERVGQYLKKSDLQFVQAVVPGSWQSFVESNQFLQESDMLFPHHPEKSLLQLFECLDKTVRSALNLPASSIGQSVKCHGELQLYSVNTTTKEETKPHRCLQQHTVAKDHRLYTLVMTEDSPSASIYLIRQNTAKQGGYREAVCLHFAFLGSPKDDDSVVSQSCSEHQILDAAFYDDKTLSFLLHEKGDGKSDECVSVLCQVLLEALQDEHFTQISSETALGQCQNICRFDLGPHVSHYRRLDNMKAGTFAVSGSRKVACVLFGNCRRVRLFDMDAEDEEESLYEDKSTLDVSGIRLEDNGTSEDNKENLSS
ncbi:anaphase-promoting complex subunit 4-like [Amphiura filiformis]|uniref:anaphase-promoting complex subunit 4-like n=1 Tax=Amphiura filiformis TaxID=82378 RepID=UPI003B221E91